MPRTWENQGSPPDLSLNLCVRVCVVCGIILCGGECAV